MMPTAARLSGAVLTAALAWLISDLVRPFLPEGTAFGWFNYVNAALGFIVGWRFTGRHAGKGKILAISSGVTAVFILSFWAIGLQALNEMLRLSLRGAYKGPFQALENMFGIALDYGAILLNPEVGVTFVVGGVFIALVVEAINRVWR